MLLVEYIKFFLSSSTRKQLNEIKTETKRTEKNGLHKSALSCCLLANFSAIIIATLNTLLAAATEKSVSQKCFYYYYVLYMFCLFSFYVILFLYFVVRC